VTTSYPASSDTFQCDACGAVIGADVTVWRCRCGGTLSWRPPPFDRERVEVGNRSIWRYRSLLPLDGSAPVTLGEGGTPLIETALAGRAVQVKLEFVMPSGSYKDRGSALLATALAAAGVRHAVEDSSGNAGASLAGYLARIGIPLKLYVPRGTAPAKLRQARAFGAEVDDSAPTRAVATELAHAACATPGNVYASHVYSPYFLAGVTTLAYELWEDLGGAVPDHVVVPAGHGLLVLGLFQGFDALRRGGFAMRLPRIHAAQAEASGPLARSFASGSLRPTALDPGATAAAGVRVGDPPRGEAVLVAVRASGGRVVAVNEDEIQAAERATARAGWYVEPTGAVAVAALERLADVLAPGDVTVVPLTGSGLKA
jgi:threonine synthase